jgi:hypothetical protein
MLRHAAICIKYPIDIGVKPASFPIVRHPNWPLTKIWDDDTNAI